MNAPKLPRLIASGAIGNVLEWFDFAIYGYFAAAIGRTFFPHADPVAQVLSAFGIFAIGFLMRPIGGALFGRLGDRLGRTAVLRLSILMMALPTFAVAVLPGYETLGIMAPVFLTLLRMVQGLSLGGEFTTSMVFLVEHAPGRRKGLIGATACVGATLGTLLGSGAGALIAYFSSAAALEDWAWRIPFAAGLLIGLAGLLLRQAAPETAPVVHAARQSLASILRHNASLIGRLAALSVFPSVAFYVMFVYIVNWLQSVDGVSPERALSINTISMVALVPMLLFAGWASDQIGARRVILIATGFGVVASLPLFSLLYQVSPTLVLLGQLGFVVSVGLMLGALPGYMVEQTPVGLRCTAVSLGYNITLGLIGGLSPMAATWLVYRTGVSLSPAFLIMAAAAVSMAAVLVRTHKARQTGSVVELAPSPQAATSGSLQSSSHSLA